MDLRQLWISLQVKISKFIVYNFFWISFTLAVIVLGGGGYFILFPKYQVYSIQKNIDLPQLEEREQVAIQRLKKISQDQIDFSKIKENPELQKLLHILPNKKEVAEIFVEFDKMAQAENFKIVNFSMSEDLSQNASRFNNLPENLGQIQIQTSLAGSGYERLKRLLVMLETNLRLIDINSLSFIPNYNGTTLYSFMITTYYIKD